MTEKLLLVEDNVAHVELMRRALEEGGYGDELRVCSNLADAHLAIQSASPCLVIADINLPDGKGTELIAVEHRDSDGYPVILMTAFGDEKIAADAIKSGALDYIVKSPEAFTGLPATVRRVLREWRYIIERKQAQEALLLKQREQENILNSIVNAVMTIDNSGAILSFNKAAERLFAYRAVEVIGRNVTLLMPEAGGEQGQYWQRYMQVSETEVNSLGVDLEGVRKNKDVFPMRLFAAELSKGIDGELRFIGSCIDLTGIKLQEEQLRRSQKMDALGKLTGGIAHDYNNMLGIILGFSELLADKFRDQAEISSYVHEIQYAAERGAKLTKKLLQFSRQVGSNANYVDINALLQSGQHMLEKTLTVRIQLTLTLAEDLWPVWLDGGELEDAIINMSINAMHAMEQGGSLVITTVNTEIDEQDAARLNIKTGQYVLLNICDTGIGMDTEMQEHIFDPFYSSKGEMGTGLGLSQVYGFVGRSGGAIHVESAPGQGTQMKLYFPRYSDDKSGSDIESTSKEEGGVVSGGQETILVVDDEKSLLSLACKILEMRGYKVLAAQSGQQALDILVQQHVDLLFSDIIMPGMDGYELVAIAQEKYPGIKVQLTSGFSDGYASAIDDRVRQGNFLVKPYRANDLLRTVRVAIDAVG